MTTTIKEAPKKMSLAELRKYDGTLWVENLTHKFISVHQDFGSERVSFDLQPHGEPGYIDEMPKLALNLQNFRKMILRGDLRISTDENMIEQVELQIQSQIEAEKIRQSGLLAQVQENSSAKDLEQSTCLTCGAMIFQTNKAKKEGTPPLCPVHQDQASQFIATLVSDDNGRETWKFNRPTTTGK